jgi:hypothetical protein
MVDDFLTEHFLPTLTLFLYSGYEKRDLGSWNEILG